MFSAFFIDRPKFALVISIIITLAGLIALTVLPVEEFPDVAPPQVQVTASYAGYQNTDRLFGDTVKRQPQGVTQYNEHGETLLQLTDGSGNLIPELFFTYQSTSGDNPGALETITYPNGGETFNLNNPEDILWEEIAITVPVTDRPCVPGSSSGERA